MAEEDLCIFLKLLLGKASLAISVTTFHVMEGMCLKCARLTMGAMDISLIPCSQQHSCHSASPTSHETQ